MRKEQVITGEIYHLCNRGHSKQNIFLDTRDYVRRSAFNIKSEDAEFKSKRIVDVIGFCLMPNHFHLIIRQIKNRGITDYMQRVLTAYAKYANTKYKKVGHVFQGPYRIVHVEDNEQLIYLSAYVHRNPRDLEAWRGKEHQYRWSS